MNATRRPVASHSSKAASITPSQLLVLVQGAHEEWLLDEALRETFPASDPIAVTPQVGARIVDRSSSPIGTRQKGASHRDK